MKQLALSLTLIIGLCFSGFSQDVQNKPAKQNAEQKAEAESVRAAKKLTLNDKQKAVYKQFVLQRIAVNKPIRQKLRTSDAASKETLTKELNANRDKFRANVNAMLNPDQQTKWNEMNKRRDQKLNSSK